MRQEDHELGAFLAAEAILGVRGRRPRGGSAQQPPQLLPGPLGGEELAAANPGRKLRVGGQARRREQLQHLPGAGRRAALQGLKQVLHVRFIQIRHRVFHGEANRGAGFIVQLFDHNLPVLRGVFDRVRD